MRKYFEEFISNIKTTEKQKGITINTNFTMDVVMVPLVGSAPCGDPFLGQQNIEKEIAVDKTKIKKGFDYFILRATGDSMDLAGINDGDLILCRQQENADNGDKVVALLGDEVTIKIYNKNNSREVLMPKSSNPIHQPIIIGEDDIVQGVVQEVLIS